MRLHGGFKGELVVREKERERDYKRHGYNSKNMTEEGDCRYVVIMWSECWPKISDRMPFEQSPVS